MWVGVQSASANTYGRNVRGLTVDTGRPPRRGRRAVRLRGAVMWISRYSMAPADEVTSTLPVGADRGPPLADEREFHRLPLVAGGEAGDVQSGGK
jgi:hypothetical protein